MQIVCTTARAAALVLHVLLSTGLRPVRDFEIHPILSTAPPTTYIMLSILTAGQVRKIRAVADTTIVG
jgi:hypothetical protein